MNPQQTSRAGLAPTGTKAIHCFPVGDVIGVAIAVEIDFIVIADDGHGVVDVIIVAVRPIVDTSAVVNEPPSISVDLHGHWRYGDCITQTHLAAGGYTHTATNREERCLAGVTGVLCCDVGIRTVEDCTHINIILPGFIDTTSITPITRITSHSAVKQLLGRHGVDNVGFLDLTLSVGVEDAEGG